MRRQLNPNRVHFPQILARPQIPHFSIARRKPNIAPRQINFLRRLAKIEHRHIMRARIAVRHPGANTPAIQRLMPALTVLINLQHFLIRNQRSGRRIVTRQISAKNQRGSKNAPQRHHRPLLVGRELRRRPSAFLVRYLQSPQRKHVRIRPGSILARKRSPVAREIELRPQQIPVIPEIV